MDDEKVVSLDAVRKLREFETDESVLYFEALWGTKTFAINAAIRDLEALRRGQEPADKPLRDPETTYEAMVIIQRIRWLVNYMALQWGMDDMVNPADWLGDPPEETP